MRLQQYINEGLEIRKVAKPHKYPGAFEYWETIDNIPVKVNFFLENSYEGIWVISFDARKMYFDDNDKIVKVKTTMKTTMKIMSFVVSTVVDFIKSKSPKIISFTESTGMKGGLPLYKRFVKEITKRFPYVEVVDTRSGNGEFMLRRTE